MQADEFYDPLTLDLRRQTQILLSKLPSDIAISTLSSTSQLLDNLSSVLAIPAYTPCIATLFRPVLFDLCARWITNSKDLEMELVALCLLIEVHEELFPILHCILQNPLLAQGPIQLVLEAPRLDGKRKRLHQILLAYYRVLQANRELPYQHYWPLTPLRQIVSDSCFDTASRLLAIRCYALQSGMGEAEREKWEKATLGELYTVDCPLDYGDALDGSQMSIDGWLMPMIELERVRSARNAIVTQSQDFYRSDTEPVQHIQSSDLCPLVVNLHGILLLRSSVSENISSSLVHTPTATKALRSLALHLATRLPVLLTSPPSAGKTLLLSHLAETLFPHVQNQLIFIHLADTSLDPRSLLGSHVSSRTQPGTFEWKEGILVRAMREGKWVVFKDIDRASNEVLALIKPLIETLGLDKWIGGRASLEVVGRGKVVAADTFALFATRSVLPSRNGTFPTPTFYGAHKLHEIVVASPSEDELTLIVRSRYPRLTSQATIGLIRLWGAVRELGTTTSMKDVGLRELEKFCLRVEQLISSHPVVDFSESDEQLPLFTIFPSTSLREEIFLTTRDVFFGSGLTASAKTHMESIARTIGTLLGLELERQDWLLSRWVPDFDVETDKDGRSIGVRVGRTRLLAKHVKREIASHAPRPFAMHRPAVLLMSRIANALALNEPVLLTGETGTGKTSAITHLAHILHQPLVSLNLSNQTESSDLIGGFRPLDARVPALALRSRFLDLFGETFSRKKNEQFEADVRKSVTQGKWKRAVRLWKESVKLAKDRIMKKQNNELGEELDSQTARKRRKVDSSLLDDSRAKWAAFEHDVEEFSVQYVSGKGRLAFGFVEGPLVQALREGNWILLDEINLAGAETLECITGILRNMTASITLTEQGSLEPVPRHPNFRLFACMNPATDVGKKDLPPNIRSRFTEIDVPPPDADRETLLSIVAQYIGSSAVSDKASIMDVSEFYLAVKDLAETRQIADGANHRPHFSMRTLTRALTFASDIASTYGLRRALWEGCLMAFTMVLDAPSSEKVTALAQKHLLSGVKNVRSVLVKEPTFPASRAQEDFVKLGPFYLERGPLPPDPADDYILTPSVERKLIDLARIILTRRFPVLIEGPTSSGKTSSIEYLAKRTGHQFIRINNHEHTDIQEYLGSYIPHPITGKLVFTDGLLVRALRNGNWIVLDELNLAPTDVLEALNRLLDDNRELVIPETGEIIRPHPHFMLFATQNPSGLYAGRKVLSRAFRNRFLEVHFADVPEAELEVILCQRCMIAPSYGKKIVAVFRELQKRRQSDRVFESKQGFATLRDLFRWAGRDALGYQELAENGYMLLAERARRDEDKVVVKEVIESVMGVKIDERVLYDFQSRGSEFVQYLACDPSDSSLIWTKAMQRLFVLVARALRFNEPVLLVGETGSGKTSVCQVYADVTSRKLHGLNCHQNTETADIIGGLRPVRNRAFLEADALQEARRLSSELNLELDTGDVENLESQLDLLKSTTLSSATRNMLDELRIKIITSKAIFEWHDGPLIDAMRNGDVFLLDEISLADDSVLERLNSVLEPSRTLVLAEKATDHYQHSSLVAQESFKLVATMNPGGDYGKKELSPALRNRFTEIWVPSIDDRNDLQLIIDCRWKNENLHQYTTAVLDFVAWLSREARDTSLFNLRDILAWVSFTNTMCEGDGLKRMSTEEIFHHAAHMTYLDGLGSIPSLAALSDISIQQMKQAAVARLNELVPCPNSNAFIPIHDPSISYRLGSFVIPRGPKTVERQLFNFQAPTTQANAIRVIRACQLTKPILLEGSPGVGKTSLITALAEASGHELCRINLSDQTDLMDLFGSDLPVDGGKAGEFSWKDGEFLRALQEGRWVLLDEMNLAPQAVLEGLNAVLDHRGSVYIPELGRTFTKHPAFRIFAAQNPLSQGGGRKGLPKSFMNRFTKVYADQLLPSDLHLVCQHLHPEIDVGLLEAMITFNSSLHNMVSIERTLGKEGTPWEFNLRDILRWIDLLKCPSETLHPADHVRTVYLHRFRNSNDRRLAGALFERTLSCSFDYSRNPVWTISSSAINVGQFRSRRQKFCAPTRSKRLLKSQLSALEAIGCSISHSTLAIVTGARDTGKTAVVEILADLTGNVLQEVHINSSTDAMDLLGGFEQVDLQTRFKETAFAVVADIELILRDQANAEIDIEAYISLRRAITKASPPEILEILSQLTKRSNSAAIFAQLTLAQTRMTEMLMYTQERRAGHFEWVDGPLVRALKAGHWLLLDGANLCSPSVLDRLNSLCETDGFLTLSEKGFIDGRIQTIKPHSNFRLFMTVDPQYGELSRAMRNRGVEIALISSPAKEEKELLHDHYRLPTLSDDISSPVFTAMRLGVRKVEHQSSMSRIPSGRALNQDSTLSHLFDIAPSLSNTSDNENSLYHFVSRCITPIAVPLLHRFFKSQPSSLGSNVHPFHLTCQKVLPLAVNALSGLRNRYVVQEMLPLPHMLAMPTDFFLGIQLSVSDPAFNHPTALNILKLVVCLTLSEPWELASKPFHSSRDKRMQRTMTAINNLLREAYSAGSLALEMSSDTLDSQTLSLVGEIMNYMYYLSVILSRRVLDYSALQPLAEQVITTSEKLPTAFGSLRSRAMDLKEVTMLSSGLGINQIWLLFHDNQFATSEILRLEELSVQIDGPPSLREQVLNLMTIASISRSTQHEIETRGITEALQLRVPAQKKSQRDEDLGALRVSHLLTRLTILSMGPSLSETAKRVLVNIIFHACNQPSARLAHLWTYQQALWLNDVAKDSAAHSTQTTSLFASWINDIWGLEDDGPAVFFKPAQLQSVLSVWDWNTTPMAKLFDYETNLYTQAQLALLNTEQVLSRPKQLAVILKHSILKLQIASCFVNADDLPEPVTLPVALGQDATSPVLILPELENLLPYSAAFKQAFKTHLQPVFTSSESSPESSPEYITRLGLCWISTGRFLLDLFIPDAPIDPAAVQNHIFEFWSQQAASISKELVLHSEFENLISGNAENGVTNYLQSLLVAAQEHLANGSTMASSRDVNRLHMFWSEILQFQEHVLDSSKLNALISDLKANDHSAELREQVTQRSINGFIQRMQTAYTDFDDILFPIRFASLHLQTGLRILKQSCIACHLTESTALAVTGFPAVRSAERFIALQNGALVSGLRAFHRLVITMAAISLEMTTGVGKMTHMLLLENTYEQASRLWHIDRKKEEEQQKASESLYRQNHTGHLMESDAEIEEREFAQLFPSFESVLSGDASSSSDLKPSSPTYQISGSDIKHFVHFHNVLFSGEAFTAALYRSVQLSALPDLLSSSAVFTDSLDYNALPLSLSLLSDRMDETRECLEPRVLYSFYTDANIQETRKAVAVVTKTQERLCTLIEEWPDQMVLRHLKERCDMFLALDLRSPVAKVLSALEQLLLHTEDWEAYANRVNSLRDHRSNMIELIVDWRRLELNCWQVLLKAETKSFEDDVLPWWFRLYDAIIRGPLDILQHDSTGNPTELPAYLDDLIPLLDDFIRGSPVGQFRIRLRLLRSFGELCHHLQNIHPGQIFELLERIRRIVDATVDYFSTFSSSVAVELTTGRTALETEIRNLIKLASWKDVNVHALKQSAQRTHRQLYKLIRKYRELLRQPVSGRLEMMSRMSKDEDSILDNRPLEIVQAPDLTFTVVAADTYTPAHLIHLGRTYRRFKQFIAKSIAPWITSRSADAVEALAVDIIVSSKELSSISLTSSLSAERREKQQKAILTRKRKAWSDLLIELKRAGFAAHVKPDVLSQNQSTRWIREQPSLGRTSDFEFEKSEMYWNRLNGLFPILRASIPSHHTDISTRELQRGVSFLESSFSMAIESRTRLSNSCSSYVQLQRHLRRIRSLASSDGAIYSATDTAERLATIFAVLCRLESALHELQNAFQSLLRLDASMADSVTGNIENLLSSCVDVRSRFKGLLENVQLTSFPILLTEEYTLTVETVEFIREAIQTMDSCVEKEPRMRPYIHPMLDWLRTFDLNHCSVTKAVLDPASACNGNEIINVCLATVEILLARSSNPPSSEERESRDHYIREDYQGVRDFTTVLKIDQVIQLLNNSLKGFATGSALDVDRYLPFLEVYSNLLHIQLTSHSNWTKSLLKLNFVLCSVIDTICRQGFCKPPEPDEEGTSSGDGVAEMSDGVGMGEGAGASNVSKEIEEESQVEGLQGEKDDMNESRDDQDDDAIEMSQDFDGDMEDVPDSGSQAEEESESESNPDPEEQIQDLDASDPAAVDEKFWGDEKGPDDGDDKTNKDSSTQQSAESEVVAKEGGNRPESKNNDPAESNDKGAESQPDAEEDEQKEAQQEVEEEDLSHPDANGAPMDEHVPEADTLDLPEDMDMGVENVTDEMDVDENENEDGLADEPTSQDRDDHQGQDDEHPTPTDLSETQEPEDKDSTEAELSGQTEQNEDGDNVGEDNLIAPRDIGQGEGDVNDEHANFDEGRDQSHAESGTSLGIAGNAAAAAEKSHHGLDTTELPEARETGEESLMDVDSTAGAAPIGSEQGQQPSRQNNQLSINPLRSLADALQEVQRRFDEILDNGGQDLPKDQVGPSEKLAALEYLRPEDTDHDMQALGPAQEEQVAKLQELNLVDDEMDPNHNAPPLPDIEMPTELGSQNHQRPSIKQLESASTDNILREGGLEGAIAQNNRQPLFEDGALATHPDGPNADIEMENAESPNVEFELRSWQAAGLPDNQAVHIWRLYESLTHELAYALCEQLRLILEPTLATRLKGDYRTGKRLNMKKIIPYIASDYTKDKIWLRRTRPSQREYQVLIAIDDSRSMAESHSVHLAYQTLALVSKALARLEAGDIGIAKFGQDVQLLHDFDGAPFSDQAGIEVIKAFHFDQKATNVLSLVDTSLRVLEAARERRSVSSSTAADLWQLEIIISDGMCQDHDKLRAALRKAEEQRVMIVFIILDSLHSGGTNKPGSAVQGSILSMEKAEFKNVDGKMELQLQRYLDSFPFEYYLVLRDVEALPQVLSATLKQFFERISEE
ncbi:midasin nuclear AAA ATPase [Lentinula aciculospora]|uniref:Midasin n=1 Tax=Lentinula aciculospora TaxID=153920 RepID=A0A9W9AHX9_9AGAR|nr:midasin nuclear AAA ATPase [Lentinula aciculospora]